MKKFLKITDSTLKEYKVKTLKDLWEKVKGKYKGFEVEVFTSFKKSQSDDNKFHAVFSTAKEDRHGDIVKQEWDLKSFKKNPVFLDSHNYDSIEYIIGKVKGANTKNGRLEGDIVFALSNPRGQLAYNLALEGFINTTSVGFMPKEFDNEGTILKSELLEVSAVSVPANPEALIEKLYDGQNNKDKGGDGKDKSGGDDSKEGGKNGDEKGKRGKGDQNSDGEDEKISKQKDWNDRWDDGPELIRLKIRDIGEFVDDSFQRENLRSILPRISGISGISRRTGNRVLQSIFFPKEDGWNLDDAKKWFTLREFDLMGKSFENKKEDEEKESNSSPAEKVKKSLINIGNKHAEQRKRGMQKVLLAIQAIKAATGEAKYAEAVKQRETNILINKAAKKILALKK